jgi:hypothetical protein
MCKVCSGGFGGVCRIKKKYIIMEKNINKEHFAAVMKVYHELFNNRDIDSLLFDAIKSADEIEEIAKQKQEIDVQLSMKKNAMNGIMNSIRSISAEKMSVLDKLDKEERYKKADKLFHVGLISSQTYERCRERWFNEGRAPYRSYFMNDEQFNEGLKQQYSDWTR